MTSNPVVFLLYAGVHYIYESSRRFFCSFSLSVFIYIYAYMLLLVVMFLLVLVVTRPRDLRESVGARFVLGVSGNQTAINIVSQGRCLSDA